jgi:hypothetical protein
MARVRLCGGKKAFGHEWDGPSSRGRPAAPALPKIGACPSGYRSFGRLLPRVQRGEARHSEDWLVPKRLSCERRVYCLSHR